MEEERRRLIGAAIGIGSLAALLFILTRAKPVPPPPPEEEKVEVTGLTVEVG